MVTTVSIEAQLEAMAAALRKHSEDLEIVIKSEHLDQMLEYARHVLMTNKTMNLTRIQSPEEFAIKHILDSLVCLRAGIPAGRGIDIGTGAGFPGIPLRILGVKPILLVDSLAKRVAFLNETIASLRLSDVVAIHGRAEELGRDPGYRGLFQWAVARAVAPLPVLLEYASPFVAVGGMVLCMKGSDANEEIEQAGRAVARLALTERNRIYVRLPLEMGQRCLIIYEKTGRTPQEFPRRPGVPTKRPL